MGLDIRVKKPINYIGKERPEENDSRNWSCIFSLGFPPINHLSQFEEGYWEIENYCSDEILQISYGGFNTFRGYITQYLYGPQMDYKTWCRNVDTIQEEKDAFKEMLHFADNEGSFDYVIATKLLKDFREHRDAILSSIPEKFYREYYDGYSLMLEKVVECKGVIYYF